MISPRLLALVDPKWSQQRGLSTAQGAILVGAVGCTTALRQPRFREKRVDERISTSFLEYIEKFHRDNGVDVNSTSNSESRITS